MKTLTRVAMAALLIFSPLVGVEDISSATPGLRGYITCEDIRSTQLEEYDYFVESLKKYFMAIGDVTKVLGDSLHEYDIHDELELLFMHILFIETQLEMMKERMPVLEAKCKELVDKLSVYVY